MRIVRRAEWGAKPPQRPYTSAKLPMRELWLHHSVTTPTDDPFHDARVIQEVAFDRGFIDVSYTLLFHPDGTILEGRNWAYVGAHTEGHNSVALGFCLIGNYEHDRPTDAQIEAVRWARHEAVSKGALIDGAPFGGHRDTKATACPGRHAYAALDRFRQPWQPSAPADEEDNMRILNPGDGRLYLLLGNGRLAHIATSEAFWSLAKSTPVADIDGRTFDNIRAAAS